MSTGVPKVRWYASTSRSAPALLAEYGLEGSRSESSVNAPSSMLPYTSSVLICR